MQSAKEARALQAVRLINVMVLQPESRKLGLRLLCPVPVPKLLPIKNVSSGPQSIPPPETGAPGHSSVDFGSRTGPQLPQTLQGYSGQSDSGTFLGGQVLTRAINLFVPKCRPFGR